MIRIFFIVFIVLILIPFVWKIVNKIFCSIDSALKSPELDADQVLSDVNALNEELNRKEKRQKTESEKIQKAKRKLSAK